MSADRRTIRVTIFGEDYQIRTDLGEEYTKQCAEYVDEAIQEAHVGGHVAEPHRAAILAALKITDEMFRARAEAAGLSEMARGRALELAEKLEAAVPGAGDAGAGDDAAAGGENAELALDS